MENIGKATAGIGKATADVLVYQPKHFFQY